MYLCITLIVYYLPAQLEYKFYEGRALYLFCSLMCPKISARHIVGTQ